MSDLIDRQALLIEYDKAHVGPPGKARKLIEDAPAASPWHRVKEPPNKTGKYVVCWTYQKKIYWDWLIFIDGDWVLQAGLPLPDYWMPIEPPKEE